MARTRENPLVHKPFEYIAREDRGRMPNVVLPSIPSRVRKHHASSGTGSVLEAMYDYSGRRYVTPPTRAIEQAMADKRLKKRYAAARLGISDSWLTDRIKLVRKFIGPRETIPRGQTGTHS